MARDPLTVLARLRRLETDQARQMLAQRLARSAAAEARVAAAEQALAVERAAERPADYGAWLQRGLAERERAQHAQALAECDADASRQALTEARAAERAVEILVADRARAAAKQVARAEQARLDDRPRRDR